MSNDAAQGSLYFLPSNPHSREAEWVLAQPGPTYVTEHVCCKYVDPPPPRLCTPARFERQQMSCWRHFLLWEGSLMSAVSKTGMDRLVD